MITEVISKQASSVRWKEGGREEEGRRDGEVSGKGGGQKEREKWRKEGGGACCLILTNLLAPWLCINFACL